MALIIELLKIQGIKTHLIEGRAKTVDSFIEKIRRPGKSYDNPLEELPDLSGVRIIVYYLDDVEKVAKILSSEFTVIESETSHLASEYSPDKFGYISLHSVVCLSSDRENLPEWRAYKGYRSEIQIRTVLQHSWAAVSHALQYKHESDVPKQLRRKLYRLAGLFELADEEFISVRAETEILRVKTAEALDHGNIEVCLNSISLKEFSQRWSKLEALKKLMESIGYIFDRPPDDTDEDTDYFGIIASYCEKLGIHTIREFESVIDYDAETFLKEIRGGDDWFVSEEFALYLLLIRAKIDEFTVDDLLSVGWSKNIAVRVIKGARANENQSKRSKDRRH
jgi:ppGpp synthetase/RelA/SpoT-type nucleotidyltranferase